MLPSCPGMYQQGYATRAGHLRTEDVLYCWNIKVERSGADRRDVRPLQGSTETFVFRNRERAEEAGSREQEALERSEQMSGCVTHSAHANGASGILHLGVYRLGLRK